MQLNRFESPLVASTAHFSAESEERAAMGYPTAMGYPALKNVGLGSSSAQAPAYVPNQTAQASGPAPAAPGISARAGLCLKFAGGVTGAISIALAPFGILSVASNNPRWHNDAVKYSCGTLSIVFGVVSVGLGALGCCLGARRK